MWLFLAPLQGWADEARWEKQIRSLAINGAVMVVETGGRTLYALNPDKPMVPASILKIVTADAALHYLGEGYRFTTAFMLSPENDLYVIGKGDPHLVSEELARIAKRLKVKGLKRIRHIFLDDSYFQPDLLLHGTNRSLNPYDAYNGALCVNFNTIFVRIGSDGKVRSAEPQTPLTDFARKVALRSGMRGNVRINLTQSPEQCLLYAGELLKSFLERSSIRVEGSIARSEVNPERFRLLYVHRSRSNLSGVLKKMFEYSNNFIANQIFLTLGAVRYGPPATVEKSRRVMVDFLNHLDLPGPRMEEGSGISRRNRLSAAHMIKVLEHFKSYRCLLSRKDPAWIKTGTLSDVKSMAGYLAGNYSEPLSFVIILNGKRFDNQTRDRIFSLIIDNFGR
jgi:D-alanyl-D-alanine carboxypeptidase/D-alanyl-D-alanine-endopeptidase (penicillin-binding protein 4)